MERGRMRKIILGAAVSAGLMAAGGASQGAPTQQDLGAIRVGLRTSLETPSAANSFYGPLIDHGTLTYQDGTSFTRPVEIVELARALRADPDLIYEYVRNNIEITPLFGLQKGALGALIDKHGTAFDQVHLMVELLREAGHTATYKVGEITLNQQEFSDWFGITNAQAACELLASGGFPGTVNGATDCTSLSGNVTTVTMTHIWAKVNIGGDFLFDPSKKPHTFKPVMVGLEAAMGYSRTDLHDTFSTGMIEKKRNGIDYISAVNEGGLEGKLDTYAANLLTDLQTLHPDDALEDIVGGRELVPEVLPAGGLRQTSLSYVITTFRTWSGDIPDQYRTKLTVQLADTSVPAEDTITATLFVDEVGGRRIDLVPDTGASDWIELRNFGVVKDPSGFDVELQVDGKIVLTHNSPLPADARSRWLLDLTVEHPYAAQSGDYMDEVIKKRVDVHTPVAIVHGWGHVGQGLFNAWSKENAHGLRILRLNETEGAGEPLLIPMDTQDSLKTRMAVGWLTNYTKMAEMVGEMTGSVPVQHHALGAVYAQITVGKEQDPPGDNTEAQWVQDQVLRVDIDSAISVTHENAGALERDAVIHTLAVAASTLEGAMVEQQADEPDAASTAERFRWAEEWPDPTNAAGDCTDPSKCGVDRKDNDRVRYYLFKPTGSHISRVGTFVEKQGYPLSQQTNLPNHLKFVGAGTVAHITEYLEAGYHVLAVDDSFLGPGYHVGSPLSGNCGGQQQIPCEKPTLQRGGAFIAFKLDGSAIAHITDHWLNLYKGGGGGVTKDQEAEFDPATAADILKDRFEDKSVIHGVSLADGGYGFTTPNLLSVGSGGFPYELSMALTFASGFDGGPLVLNPKRSDLGDLVTHSFETNIALSGSSLEAMGATSHLNAAASIVGLYATYDAYLSVAGENQVGNRILGILLLPFINDWWAESMKNNVASVSVGPDSRQFVKLADGSYNSPKGDPSVLARVAGTKIIHRVPGQQNIDNFYRYADWQFTLTLPDQSVQTFDYRSWLTFTGSGAAQNPAVWKIMLETWAFPFGVTVDYLYDTHAERTHHLLAVSNNIGRTIDILRDPTTHIVTGFGDLTGRVAAVTNTVLDWDITTPAGDVMKVLHASANPATDARPYESYRFISQIFEPWAYDSGAQTFSQASLNYIVDAQWRAKEVEDAQRIADLAAGPPERPAHRFFIANGSRGERLDPAGGEFAVYYDLKGRAIEFIELIDGLGRVSVVTADYDNHNRITRRVFPELDESLFVYNANHQVTGFTQKAKPASTLPNRTVSAVYHGTYILKPTSVTDTLGNVTTLVYQAATGNVLSATLPGTAPYTYSYNGFGQRLTVTDPEGRVTLNSYSTAATGSNLLSTEIDDLGFGLTTYLEYDLVGNIIAVRDPRSASSTDNTFKTSMTFDLDRRELDTIGPLGNKSRNTYTGGRLTKVEALDSLDVILQTTLATFTPTGQELTVTSPDGAVITNAYDPADRLLTVTDPVGRITKSVYDLAGQLLIEQRAFGTPLQQDYATFMYTDNGQQAEVKDANGNLTTFDYDGFDRMEKVTFPDGKTEVLTYDAANNPLRKKTRKNEYIKSAYDVRGRQVRKLLSASDPSLITTACGTTPLDTCFVYDGVGRQTQARFGDGGYIIDYVFDTAGRLQTVTDSGTNISSITGPRTVAYLLDAATNVIKITHPDGTWIDQTFDVRSLTSGIFVDQPGFAGNIQVAAYTYDALGRRTLRDMAGEAVVAYSYETDSALDVLDIDLRLTANDVIFTFDYTLANQMSLKDITNVAYVYDGTGTPDTTYTAANNLNQYPGLNQAGNPITFMYDDNGNLTTDGTWSYDYDIENRLIGATKTGTTVAIEYDPLGRMSAKTIIGVARIEMVYDGVEMLAQIDPAGVVTDRWVWGPGVDEPIAWSLNQTLTSLRHLVADHQGSVIGRVFVSGTSETRHFYDEWGVVQDADSQNFKYTGQFYEPTLGLYYYKARWYAPTLGRFLQTDLAGYADNLNLYAYVGNDPVNLKDPSGLCGSRIDGAVSPNCSGGTVVDLTKAGQQRAIGLTNNLLSSSSNTGRINSGNFTNASGSEPTISGARAEIDNEGDRTVAVFNQSNAPTKADPLEFLSEDGTFKVQVVGAGGVEILRSARAPVALFKFLTRRGMSGSISLGFIGFVTHPIVGGADVKGTRIVVGEQRIATGTERRTLFRLYLIPQPYISPFSSTFIVRISVPDN